jgi:hypothetical protein
MFGYRSYRAALITGGVASVLIDMILCLSLMLTEVAFFITLIIIKMRNCPRVIAELAQGIAIISIGVFYIGIFASADAAFQRTRMSKDMGRCLADLTADVAGFVAGIFIFMLCFSCSATIVTIGVAIINI